MNNNKQILYIDDNAQLSPLLERLKDEPWFALDTEFIREKTYYPQLCLIQVATLEYAACIDPLSIDHISPLLDIIYRLDITKVMHAGRQDLEIFYNMRGELPANIFDTQIAAPYLGLSEQISYAAAVDALLGVSLSKTMTRTDWRARPLTPEQLQYAGNDVIYLAQLYEKMQHLLSEKNRLEWPKEDTQRLLKLDNYEQKPELAWRKIRGFDKLRGPALAALAALANWRETLAKTTDSPRNWIVRDDVLLEIARILPKHKQALRKIRGIQEKWIRQYGDTVLEIIADSRSLNPPELKPKAFQRLSGDQNAMADILMSLVRSCGAEHGISPGVIASRKDLEKLILGQPTNLSNGWRFELIGEQLKAMLNGELAVKIHDDRIELIRP